MRHILLVCNAGMSTSLLVVNMEKAAKAEGIDVVIKAVPLVGVEQEMKKGEWEIIMLGPQVRHELKGLKKRYEDIIPIEIIEMRDYGMMNGSKVLNAALSLIEK